MSRMLAVACAGLLLAAAARGETPDVAAPALESAAEPSAGEKRFGVSLDPTQSVVIESEEFEAVREAGSRRFIFRKNVEVTQADVLIRSDRLDAYYPPDAKDPDRLEAEGSVVVTQGDRELRCDRATYHRDKDMLICTGSAELRDGVDRVRGAVIEFDLAREIVVITGGAVLELTPRSDPSGEEPPR